MTNWWRRAGGAFAISFLLFGCTVVPKKPSLRTYQSSDIRPLSRLTAKAGEKMLGAGAMTLERGILLWTEKKVDGFSFSIGFYPQVSINRGWTYHTFQFGPTIDGLGAINRVGPSTTSGPFPTAIGFSDSSKKLCVVGDSMNRALCIDAADTREVWRPVLEKSPLHTLTYLGKEGGMLKFSCKRHSRSPTQREALTEIEHYVGAQALITCGTAHVRISDVAPETITYEMLPLD